MKKFIMIAVAVVLFSAQGMAQSQLTPEQKEQHQVIRMENRCIQLSTALALDDATATRFTEVYKRYKADMRAVRKQFKMHRPKKANPTTGTPQVPLTDEQVEQNILNRFAMSRATLDVREKYYKEFRTFMNPKQIQKLYNLEKKQGQKMQSRHHGSGPKGGKGYGGPTAWRHKRPVTPHIQRLRETRPYEHGRAAHLR